jgi:septum formation protein
LPGAADLGLILASASPRRRELLSLLGIPFRIVVSDFDEDSLRGLSDPLIYVAAAARGKARAVATREDGLILGVDTDVVAPNGAILGKPSNRGDAAQMLRLLSGRTHVVYSSICLIRAKSGIMESADERTVRTDVTFSALTDALIDRYLDQNEYADKAGAYGIQGAALALVERIDGDLSNVIGLPLPAVRTLLSESEAAMLHRQSPVGDLQEARMSP